MPFYDYMCESCGAEFEIQRSMTDTSKVKCDACKSSRTTKIFAPTGIHFKGSGFYVTDSKGNGSNPASKAGSNGKPDAETAPKESAKTEQKTDRKVDTTTGPKADAKADKTTEKKKQPAGKQ